MKFFIFRRNLKDWYKKSDHRTKTDLVGLNFVKCFLVQVHCLQFISNSIAIDISDFIKRICIIRIHIKEKLSSVMVSCKIKHSTICMLSSKASQPTAVMVEYWSEKEIISFSYHINIFCCTRLI